MSTKKKKMNKFNLITLQTRTIIQLLNNYQQTSKGL